MKYYDTHCHLNFPPLLENTDKIIEECEENGIILNNVGIDLKSSKLAVEQSKKHKNCFAIIGIHPSEISELTLDKDISEIEVLAKINKKVKAIGETGLDYHYENTNKQIQVNSFIKHIKLANKLKLPLVVHTRDAYLDTYKLLKNYKKNKQKIIIHCFTGTKDELKGFLSLGCYISISGIITFKNANILKQAVKFIPLDKLLIETDSPYLAPVPYRGQVNLPNYIDKVFKELINIFPLIKEEELKKIILENSLNVFNSF